MVGAYRPLLDLSEAVAKYASCDSDCVLEYCFRAALYKSQRATTFQTNLRSCRLIDVSARGSDETFILESFKGRRSDLPRAARKRGGKAARRGLSVEQIPVMVARDRSGAMSDAVLPRLDTASITKALGSVISRPAELCCDGGTATTAFARRAGLTLHVLPAPGTPKPEAQSGTSTT
jgi:hypothetical protein